MALPAEVRSHHTVWLQDGEERAVAVRYVVAGENLVCFGDRGMSSIKDGQHVSATVHAIAGGAPLVTFGVTISELGSGEADMTSVAELLENVMRSDGTVEGALRWLEEQRSTRRILQLVP